MNPLKALARFRSRDKPKNQLGNMSFLFGKPSSSGQMVNEQTAMQPLFQTIHLPSAGLQYSLGAFAQLKKYERKMKHG